MKFTEANLHPSEAMSTENTYTSNRPYLSSSNAMKQMKLSSYENPALCINDEPTLVSCSSNSPKQQRNVEIEMDNKALHSSSVEFLSTNEPEDESPSSPFWILALLKLRNYSANFLKKHSKLVRKIISWTLVIGYFVYFGFAISISWNSSQSYCHGIRFLFVLTVIVVGFNIYFRLIKRYASKTIDKHVLKPVTIIIGKVWSRAIVRWLWYGCLIAAVVIFLAFDTAGNRQRLISATGVVVLTIFGFIFSKHPGHIKWRQVFWGLGFQFLFALIILRWNVGIEIFQCLGDKVSEFLSFTNRGSSFVFGYLVTGQLNDWDISKFSNHSNATSIFAFDGKLPIQAAIFAFKVLPVIFFFSFFISVLYYYGAMQWIVVKLGWLLQVTVGTTAAESINAAANIFIGQSEAPLVIQPFLSMMTKSELHAVMTGGFATIAGGVLAAYINFGVSASHLLSASVMSAPAALGFSKLFYPEIEKSSTTVDDINISKGTERNALEAAANGASNAVILVGNIVANLIAFIAFIAFLNFIVSWFFMLIGYDYVTFDWILSKLFIPLAYIMGVEWSECEKVARLIGLKTVVNEFVAYADLAQMVKQGQLSSRAEAIATYALCGFSNLSSIGIQLGGLGAMAPQRKSDCAEVAIRALIAGSVACFLTACIAGTLINN
ncbi:hypothetical protein CHUAL_001890 [Chamberlinius hualienensis]